MSRVLLLFIFSLSVLVGSINGRSCGSSTPTSEDMYQKQMERADESADRMGRIGLECEPQGYTGGSGNTNYSVGATILGFFILFFIFGAPIVICLACIRRQKAINAANLNNVSSQVVGAHVAHGTDLKSYPGTNTVQKGDPNYQV
ncbi:unnamed protein product [Arabidopsis lyrata]|uniref:Transmembrane protein n=1 Tax=Arabidopsis lyrata subsp. lyrata TaxID=81972 RepID=D7M2E4_ARALL|nr:uncharacterized protein LOC9310219 [Arabidopsis lyrata subsp. lyrata]EFH48341.1 hypothetical protein ARALYDRAFT_489252 [Arabidopsis lyrata subsp. lyrata]CAH8272036.1 unnamed protein product [Arabidopsis lyrata]|eukprot:XP_002872082.1 uncharacterized protein LOC9310219 [Arabidopsis lyrata subsp. lyrata]